MQILNEKGYTNAYALIGGTPVWKNAGYPMEGEAANANTGSNTYKTNSNSGSK